jgi:hypothetical protein
MALPRRSELLLLLGSTLASLLALELGIRTEVVPLPDYVHSSGWRRERWLRERADGVQVTSWHRIDRHDPTLGWTLLEDLRGVDVAGGRVHSNSAGMRGRREYPLQRSAAPRFVVLGDSFSFGECVEDDESFAARLEQRIAPGEVLNLAVHGYGHDQQLLRLQRQGLAYRPDAVLLGFFNADVDRNQLSFRDYAKPRFRLRRDELVLVGVPIPSPDAYAEAFHLRSASYAEMLWDTLFERRLERRNRKLTQAILQRVAAESRGIGARPALVYLPSENQSRAGVADPSRVYRRLCAAGDFLCIDPTPRIHAFLAAEPDPGAHFRCHYSAEVHRQIADEIASSLAAAGVLPASAAAAR